jgi:acyl dehydratase
MTDAIRSLDDLSPGQSWDLGTLSLPRSEVIAFAARYDPQYFHLDAEAARESLFGELVVSGLHTLSAVFGHIMRSGLITDISIGGNQIDSRWPAPLRPDEEIAVRVEVAEVRPSRSGRPLGIAKLRYTARRVADGVMVLDAVGTHFLRR